MMTVALGLLAFKIAGDKAGAVLGTALAIKMIAYVGVAPMVGGFANFLPRRAFLVSMDIVRAAVALVLPFVDRVWQIYLLIFILQSASAAFTPTFQATIPDVLPEENEYTRALSLSRLAYDMESLLSPVLAAALLTVIAFNWLFVGTVVGFFCSAALVLSVTIPQPETSEGKGGLYENTTRGIRIYLATPRLRGLLALNLCVAAAGAMVIVNTVVIVRGLLGGTDTDVAIALACFGGGSMASALMLPRLLDWIEERSVMLAAGTLLGVALFDFAATMFLSLGEPAASKVEWSALLLTWVVLGVAYSAVMTPAGRLLRRSAHAADRPVVFAAQFALSHACWLLMYPLAGWLGSFAGIAPTSLVLAALNFAGVLIAWRLWPAIDSDVIPHQHPELPSEHPHLQGKALRHVQILKIEFALDRF